MKEYTPWVIFADDKKILGDSLTDYINMPEVRQAMNIPDDV